MKFLSRRRLMQQGGLVLGGCFLNPLLTPRLLAEPQQTGMPMPPISTSRHTKTLDAMKLASFVDPLPLPQLLRSVGKRPSVQHHATDATFYQVTVREVWHKMHRDLPPTRQWSYGEGPAPILFEAMKDEGVLVEWRNHLPPRHFLPLDSPMQDMPDAPPTRMVAHLHGARVPTISDGYPDDWFAPGSSKLCFYPNHQDATALWVHDHAMGVSRMNVFAGLMGWYLLRDDHESSLNLPAGKYELPLMIYDRSFDPHGQLFYPNPPDEGAWAQEYLGDAMVVNGKVRPFHPVEPRQYRLRIVNTSNSRFLSLAFSNGQGFRVIGADQGLLTSPIATNRLVLSPAERTDLIVDFAEARGTNIQLISDALDILQFRVGEQSVTENTVIPATLRSIERIPESQATRHRNMTLNEFDSDYGEPMVMLLNRKHWREPVTEIVKLDSTEVWSLINLTEDTHPIHLHMVRFQILDRQSISTFDYLDREQLVSTGPVLTPAPHELGWKDVVQCPPGTVTRIIIPFSGYIGRYLWHCHILEHEANDMMRPFQVIA